jgi:hypothetical protein
MMQLPKLTKSMVLEKWQYKMMELFGFIHNN